MVVVFSDFDHHHRQRRGLADHGAVLHVHGIALPRCQRIAHARLRAAGQGDQGGLVQEFEGGDAEAVAPEGLDAGMPALEGLEGAPAPEGLDAGAPEGEPSAGLGGLDAAQDSALNGAQIREAKQIVIDVANGLIPRESGIGMLVEFFHLDPARAERIMSTVGNGFVPAEQPEPSFGGGFRGPPR